jgi:pimeloyl-ACP methyl ester carboxylesterase
MSLGGLTAIELSAQAPDLVRRLVLVDVLPGLKARRSQHIGDFVNGPASFDSLDELLERTIAFNPSRSRSSLRRGIVHNAQQQPDGTWVWRWARHRGPAAPPGQPAAAQSGAGQAAGTGPAGPVADGTRFARLWSPLAAITVPLLLVRGMRPDSVLDDDDERELRRRVPSAQVVHVAQAGHSVQGDAPLELAAIIENFVF